MPQFSFLGTVDHDGHFRIHATSLDLEHIKSCADSIIDQEPDEVEVEFGDPCNEILGCSQQCLTLQNALGRKCIRDQIKDAKKHKKKLASLHLLREFALNPWAANGMETLMGMAQDSCIYDTQ